MKAEFDGQDYMLILDKDEGELGQLRDGKLEASLERPWGGGDLGKMVSLEFEENNGMDGIKLVCLPENAGSWEAIEKVEVKVNKRAYNYVREIGQFGTRYNGSDKIEILDGRD